MMSSLRKNMKGILIFVIISFVAFIFLQWGMNIASGSDLRREENIVGSVGKVKIPRNVYIAKINEIRQAYMQNSGRTSIDGKEEKYIEDQAFNNIVDEIIFNDIETKYGYFATNNEIVEIIYNVPPQELRENENFMIEGNFSLEMYRQFLQTPQGDQFYSNYFNQIADQLPKMKMQADIVSGVKIGQDEILRELRLNESKFIIEYTVIPNDYNKEIIIGDEEAKVYFENNEEQFYQSPKAEIQMVMLKKEPSTQDVLLAKENIDGIRNDILSGGISFEKAASLYSDDFQSATNKGSLGYVGKGQTVTEFDKALFSLKKGDVSLPFKTMFGWHIIKCEDIKKDSIKASHILIRIKPSYETLQTQHTKFEAFLKQAKNIGLEEAAIEFNYEVINTQPFDYETGYIFEFNDYASKIAAFVQNSKIGNLSNILDESDYFVICEVITKNEKGIPQLKDIKDIVVNRMIREKKRILSSIKLMEYIKNIKTGNISIKSFANKEKLKYFKTKMINVSEKMDYVQDDSRLIGGILASKDNDTYFISDYDYGYIFRIIDREEIKLEESKELIDKYHQMLINEKQQMMLSNWAATITDVYNIKDLRY